jgi:hypothetical protein
MTAPSRPAPKLGANAASPPMPPPPTLLASQRDAHRRDRPQLAASPRPTHPARASAPSEREHAVSWAGAAPAAREAESQCVHATEQSARERAMALGAGARRRRRWRPARANGQRHAPSHGTRVVGSGRRAILAAGGECPRLTVHHHADVTRCGTAPTAPTAPPRAALLAPERVQRIHAHRPSCRDETGSDRHEEQQDGDPDERRRVGRRDAEQELRQHST